MQLEELDIQGKKVLLRVDFNVPLHNGQVRDDSRLRAALPTINYLLEAGVEKLILCSHLGRPLKKLDAQGQIQREKFSLGQVCSRLAELLHKPIHFAPDCIGEQAQKAITAAPASGIILLENTRFHEGEEQGDEELARELAQLADIYINDAFGTAHRAHASTAVVAQYFGKEQKATGLLMRRELEEGKKLLNKPEQPFVAILGGAKVSDKLLLIERLMDSCQRILIGGGMAFTFIKALGGEVGTSLLEEERIPLCLDLLKEAKQRGVEILLPSDSRTAEGFDRHAEAKIESIYSISPERMGLDIGPETAKAFATALADAKTILWNGPMGVFEFKAFSKGTAAVAQALAQASEAGAYSLIGGGDSAAAIQQTGLASKVSFISTGGGAMLELLEGKKLPGVAALDL